MLCHDPRVERRESKTRRVDAVSSSLEALLCAIADTRCTVNYGEPRELMRACV